MFLSYLYSMIVKMVTVVRERERERVEKETENLDLDRTFIYKGLIYSLVNTSDTLTLFVVSAVMICSFLRNHHRLMILLN